MEPHNNFTIVSAEGEEFHVNLEILRNRTEYFNICYYGDIYENKRLQTDISSDDLIGIIKYCHTSTLPKFVNIDGDIQFMHLFDRWLLFDAVKQIENRIVTKITFENVIHIFNTANNFPTVVDRCVKLFKYASDFEENGIFCYDYTSKEDIGYCCLHDFNKHCPKYPTFKIYEYWFDMEIDCKNDKCCLHYIMTNKHVPVPRDWAPPDARKLNLSAKAILDQAVSKRLR